MRRLAAALVCWGFLNGAAFAAAPAFPPLTGRIVDTAHLLDATTATLLEAKLAQHEQATGEQVVVVTLPTLNNTPIEEYGYRLGRAWGIGQKGKNNGALLIVAVADRAVRIEVGYGLEGRLTDAASALIISRLITPAFRAGDYPGGITQGVDAVLALLGGGETAQSLAARTASQGDDGAVSPWALLLLILCLWLISRRSGRNTLAGSLVLGSLLGRSGGGSGGFGGFSGGGGSFGGGGASGGW